MAIGKCCFYSQFPDEEMKATHHHTARKRKPKPRLWGPRASALSHHSLWIYSSKGTKDDFSWGGSKWWYYRSSRGIIFPSQRISLLQKQLSFTKMCPLDQRVSSPLSSLLCGSLSNLPCCPHLPTKGAEMPPKVCLPASSEHNKNKVGLEPHRLWTWILELFLMNSENVSNVDHLSVPQFPHF